MRQLAASLHVPILGDDGSLDIVEKLSVFFPKNCHCDQTLVCLRGVTYGLKRRKLKIRPYLTIGAFPGRLWITKLRCDDVPLGDAGYNRHTWCSNKAKNTRSCAKKHECPLCGNPNETISHFLLHCRAAEHVREKHKRALSPRINQIRWATRTICCIGRRR